MMQQAPGTNERFKNLNRRFIPVYGQQSLRHTTVIGCIRLQKRIDKCFADRVNQRGLGGEFRERVWRGVNPKDCKHARSCDASWPLCKEDRLNALSAK